MNKKILTKYKTFLKEHKNMSANTIENYERDINIFIEKMGSDIYNKQMSDIETYISIMKRENKTNKTIARNISSIRSFYQFLLNENKVNQDPTYQVKYDQTYIKTNNLLSLEEVDLLLSLPDTNTNKGLRDKVILEIIYGTGAKTTDIVELKIQDISLEYEYIKLGEAKERYIPIGPNIITATVSYLEEYREKIFEKDNVYLFLNIKKTKLTRQGVWNIVNSYSKYLNRNNLNPGIIRESFINHMIINGANIKMVNYILGNKEFLENSIEEVQGIKSMYKKIHPRL